MAIMVLCEIKLQSSIHNYCVNYCHNISHSGQSQMTRPHPPPGVKYSPKSANNVDDIYTCKQFLCM